MSYTDIKDNAVKWTQSNPFTCDGCENESKLTFCASEGSNVNFWLKLPTALDKEWTIWSENDAVIARLQDVIDFVGSCKAKTIEDILDKTYKALKPMLGATAESGEDDDMDEDDDGYEDDAGYYEEEDEDAINDTSTKLHSSEEDISADRFFTGDGSSTAVHRLLKDLKSVKSSSGKFGVTGGPRDDNLFLWDVKLTDFPKDTKLGKDLLSYAQKFKTEPVVSMEMKFPSTYPMAPPFVRVLTPRFKFLTGHVTVGGSICMELLTRSGWIPTNEIESILVQIRAEIMSDDKATLDWAHIDRPYDETEAKVAFERMVTRYGWNK